MAGTTDWSDGDAAGPLLFGRVLDGRGGARPIGWAEAASWAPANEGEILWLHTDRTWPGMRSWLQERLGVCEPTAELLTSDDSRPRAFREKQALVATLRSVNLNPGTDPEDMVSMQLWSDGRRLITLRRHPLQSPREVLAMLDGDEDGPTDAGSLITQLIEHMIQRMNSAVVDINTQIDTLFAMDCDGDDANAVLTSISAIRRDCLAMKRHMGPEHVALEAISRDAPPWFEEHDRREIYESISLLRRFLDDIDVSKESAVVLMDELRGRAVSRTERTNRLLTVVSTVFLPLTFLTGLIGMNVAGIPAADHPLAFWIVVGLCAVIVVVQVIMFRRWRWL